MDSKLLVIGIVVIVAIVALVLLTLPTSTGPASARCGDGKCDLGETAESCPQDCTHSMPICNNNGVCDGSEDPQNCPADCAPISGDACRDDADCPSGICDFYKQDAGDCAPETCQPGEQTTGVDGYINNYCNDQGVWMPTKSEGAPCSKDYECGRQTCKDNPSCGLSIITRTSISCENGVCTSKLLPDECAQQGKLKVLPKEYYGPAPACMESLAQMELPTICIDCGNGVCDEDESECNCPKDCADVLFVNYDCIVDYDCVSTCAAGCVNSIWSKTYQDPCLNARPWDCTCVSGKCYTDGKAPGMGYAMCGDGACSFNEDCPEDCGGALYRCANYVRNGVSEEHCATCGNGECEPFETCTSSSSGPGYGTDDCGGLYCPEDCETTRSPVGCTTAEDCELIRGCCGAPARCSFVSANDGEVCPDVVCEPPIPTTQMVWDNTYCDCTGFGCEMRVDTNQLCDRLCSYYSSELSCSPDDIERGPWESFCTDKSCACV